MSKTTLIISDEVNCRFTGLDAKVRRKMVKELKFFIPWAFHMPSYKLGRWDGTVSFCTMGGATQINLLDKVLPIVIDAGYEVEIDDRRPEVEFDFPDVTTDYLADTVWPKGHVHEGEPIYLRDYQVEIINSFLENKQCIQEIATGAGKTIITATLSKIIEPYGRTVVIVPNKSLVGQTEADYKNIGLDVGVFYGERKEVGHQHVICTWQSLNIMDKKSKDYDEDLIGEFLEGVSCVMVDEAHSAKADVLKKLLTGAFSHCPLRFGLTGTVPKEDFISYSLISSIGPVVNRLQASELQEKGVLSNCEVNVMQMKEVAEFSDFQEEQEYLLTNKDRIAFIAETAKEAAKSGNTLILVNRIQTGEILHEMIPDAVFIRGATKLSERKEHYDEVHESEGKVIIATYGVAAVGINIPRIFNLFLIEPGKSFVRVIQSIGRGIRKAKDKDFVQIWDVCATTKYSKKHLTERKKYYKEQNYPYSINKVQWF
jgi:superfamily II DNA or RNA helicase